MFGSTRVNCQPFLFRVDITLSCNLIYLEEEFALSFTQLNSQPVQGSVDLGRVGFLGGWDTRIPGSSTQHGDAFRTPAVAPVSACYTVYYATFSSDSSFFYIAQVVFGGFL